MRVKKLLQKTMALALCIALAGTFAGCGSQPTGGDSQSTEKKESVESSSAADAQESKVDAQESTEAEASREDAGSDADPYGKYEEPVKLSVLKIGPPSTDWDSSNHDRRSYTENIWIDAYMDYLNIEVEMIIAEDDTARNALINTGMASNDLPDVLIVSKSMFFTMAENGVLQDLGPAYEEYISTKGRLVKQMVDTMPGCIEAATINGQMLGFPMIPNSYNDTEVLWIRQDWLDQVDMEAPTTIEEMLEVARAFQEKKPGGEGTLGLGLPKASMRGYRSLMAPYGVVYNQWTQNSEGIYEFYLTDERMKDALGLMQQLYKEKLVKPDFATTDILGEEIANGQVGMFYGQGWRGATDVKQSLINDENAEWIAVPIPTLDGKPVEEYTNAAVGDFIVVTSGCQHPEAIFKMLELEKHMYFEPEAEESLIYYIAEDQYPVWNMMIFRNCVRADLDMYRGVLIREALADDTPLEEIDALAQGAYKQVLDGLGGERNMVGYVPVYTQAYKIIQDNLDAGLLKGDYPGPLTENRDLYETTLHDTMTTEFMKIVMGADVSDWDAAVESWYQNGGQAITDDVNAYYNSL